MSRRRATLERGRAPTLCRRGAGGPRVQMMRRRSLEAAATSARVGRAGTTRLVRPSGALRSRSPRHAPSGRAACRARAEAPFAPSSRGSRWRRPATSARSPRKARPRCGRREPPPPRRRATAAPSARAPPRRGGLATARAGVTAAARHARLRALGRARPSPARCAPTTLARFGRGADGGGAAEGGARGEGGTGRRRARRRRAPAEHAGGGKAECGRARSSPRGPLRRSRARGRGAILAAAPPAAARASWAARAAPEAARRRARSSAARHPEPRQDARRRARYAERGADRAGEARRAATRRGAAALV